MTRAIATIFLPCIFAYLFIIGMVALGLSEPLAVGLSFFVFGYSVYRMLKNGR